MAEQAIPGWTKWLEASGDQVVFLSGFFLETYSGAALSGRSLFASVTK